MQRMLCAAATVMFGAVAFAQGPADALMKREQTMPDSLLQGAFAIGGAITQNRTHYFVAGDFSSQNRTAPITTPLALPGTTYEGKFRRALVSARLDHKLNAAQSLMVRLNLDRVVGRHCVSSDVSVAGNERRCPCSSRIHLLRPAAARCLPAATAGGRHP